MRQPDLLSAELLRVARVQVLQTRKSFAPIAPSHRRTNASSRRLSSLRLASNPRPGLHFRRCTEKTPRPYFARRSLAYVTTRRFSPSSARWSRPFCARDSACALRRYQLSPNPSCTECRSATNHLGKRPPLSSRLPRPPVANLEAAARRSARRRPSSFPNPGRRSHLLLVAVENSQQHADVVYTRR